jgi:hypothetical protein
MYVDRKDPTNTGWTKKDSSINLRHIAQLYTDRSNDYVYYACIHVFRIDHDGDDDNDAGRLILTKKRNRSISLIFVNTFN